jgi:U3 small nucleolar RNA-associated protein 22
MFAHPTTDYDFIIYLKPSVVTRYTQNLFANPAVWGSGTKYANIRSESSASVYGDAIRLDFDPVDLFIRELQVRING